jgi:hypothetical protein
MEHVWSHPPRIARGLARRLSYVERLERPLDTRFGSNCTQFSLIGPEGCAATTVFGVQRKDLTFVSPICLGSPDQQRAWFTFNDAIHGYDGEMFPDLSRSPRALRQLVCPTCSGRLFECSAVFEYPCDREGLEEDDLWARREDFFTWFYLVARCAACGWQRTVASVECA